MVCPRELYINSTDELAIRHYKISKYIEWVASVYQIYHPMVSLSLIVVGMGLGLINLIILNFRRMISPTNRLLSCIGLTDMITMGLYIPYVIYFHIIDKCGLINGTPSKSPAVFLYCFIVLMAVSHCTSIWLAIGLSGLRLYVMKHPTQSEIITWRLMKIITTAIVCISLSTSSVYIINTVINQRNITLVKPINNHNISNTVIVEKYFLNQTGAFVIGFHGFFVKLLPSVLLTIMIIFIVLDVRQFKSRRKTLGKNSNISHTTQMLIGVVGLFIIVELPQGIIILISAANSNFYREIYNGLGDILDLMTIIRTIANFFIYCSMSTMFREYLLELCCKIHPNSLSTKQMKNLTLSFHHRNHRPTLRSFGTRSSVQDVQPLKPMRCHPVEDDNCNYTTENYQITSFTSEVNLDNKQHIHYLTKSLELSKEDYSATSDNEDIYISKDFIKLIPVTEVVSL